MRETNQKLWLMKIGVRFFFVRSFFYSFSQQMEKRFTRFSWANILNIYLPMCVCVCVNGFSLNIDWICSVHFRCNARRCNAMVIVTTIRTINIGHWFVAAFGLSTRVSIEFVSQPKNKNEIKLMMLILREIWSTTSSNGVTFFVLQINWGYFHFRY